VTGDPTHRDPLHDDQAALEGTVVRGGSFAALSLLSKQLVSFSGFLVLARLAGPHTFGSYSAAAILIGWGALFTDAGMQAAVVQRLDRLDEAASTGFFINLVGGMMLGVLAAALAPLVGLFFHSFEVGLAAAALAGTVPITAISIVPGALLQRRFSLRRVLVEPLNAVAFVVVSALTLASGLGIWGLVLGTYAAAVTRTLSIWFLAAWRPKIGLASWKMYKELSGFGRQVLAGEALREFGRVGNAAVVGRVLGISTLGEYRYALNLVTQTTLPITFGSAYVLLPAFSRIWHDDERFRRALFRSLRILSAVVFPISLAFLPLGKAFATVLFGARWEGAGPIMMGLAGVGIAYALDSVSSEIFKARGRPDLLPRMHALTAVIPIILLLPLAEAFGSVGAGIAMSAGTLAVGVYALSVVGRLCAIPLRQLAAQVSPALLAAGLMAGALGALEHLVFHADRGGAAGLALLLVEILIGAAVYTAALSVIALRSLLELLAVARTIIGGRRTALSTEASA
jgi:O-antigen/teichoic acid export membrane protein